MTHTRMDKIVSAFSLIVSIFLTTNFNRRPRLHVHLKDNAKTLQHSSFHSSIFYALKFPRSPRNFEEQRSVIYIAKPLTLKNRQQMRVWISAHLPESFNTKTTIPIIFSSTAFLKKAFIPPSPDFRILSLTAIADHSINDKMYKATLVLFFEKQFGT